jgi:hypothetical protein
MVLAALPIVLVVCCSSCSGSDEQVLDPDVSAATTVAGAPVSPSTEQIESSDAPTTARSGGSSTTIAIVPETGVPGLDSDDLFCRAWSEFGGSVQAVGQASVFATDPMSAIRAELAASGALIAATGGLAAHLPTELESERGALLVILVGPILSRADRARNALVAAGIDGAQLDQLTVLWLDTLAVSGLEDPNIEVAVPDELVAPFEEATASFAREMLPFATDSSLIVDPATPLTLAYIADNCPDQGILGGNDQIDQP